LSNNFSRPEGITHPPIDDMVASAGTRYQLVLWSAKRARQVNAYFSQLNEGLLEYVGPVVDSYPQEKALSIALREISDGLITAQPYDPEKRAEELAARLAKQQEAPSIGLVTDVIADEVEIEDEDSAVPDSDPA
jgi:DNA-directed RNA polymerase subunit omega